MAKYSMIELIPGQVIKIDGGGPIITATITGTTTGQLGDIEIATSHHMASFIRFSPVSGEITWMGKPTIRTQVYTHGNWLEIESQPIPLI
jgi:hypothetical protein